MGNLLTRIQSEPACGVNGDGCREGQAGRGGSVDEEETLTHNSAQHPLWVYMAMDPTHCPL